MTDRSPDAFDSAPLRAGGAPSSGRRRALVGPAIALDALAIARRFGDRDLEFAAQAVLGHAYVVSGRIEEGMGLIDEAMAAVAGGEVAGIDAIGSIYCRLLGACERATDVSARRNGSPPLDVSSHGATS